MDARREKIIIENAFIVWYKFKRVGESDRVLDAGHIVGAWDTVRIALSTIQRVRT